MKLLLAEDDTYLRQGLSETLVKVGFTVDAVDNGVDALHQGLYAHYQAAIVDLGLPQLDGLSVLKQWRSAGIHLPVLLLTARDHWSEKVAGIDAGADDYLTKPFHSEELVARLHALIRRSQGIATPTLSCGDTQLDPRTGSVQHAGTSINLTAHEFKLLHHLMLHANQMVTRAELVEHLYAYDFDRDSNTIEVFVARLRKKLKHHNIETVRGMGYRMTCPTTATTCRGTP